MHYGALQCSAMYCSIVQEEIPGVRGAPGVQGGARGHQGATKGTRGRHGFQPTPVAKKSDKQ